MYSPTIRQTQVVQRVHLNRCTFFIGEYTRGNNMTQGDYTFSVVKDRERNIIGILVRYKCKDAIIIPLIDIILQMEKII